MTWKRVATAAILIPVVVAIVLFTPTSVVAIATGIITILALREYFALGDAIGHRAYRFWTISCALLLIGQPWFLALVTGGGESAPRALLDSSFTLTMILPEFPIIVFVLGLAVLTLFTRRRLVESLPAAGISSSALLLVALPLAFAVRLHAFGPYRWVPRLDGRLLLLFALVITWAADTFAYFAGRALGKHPLAPHISPKKTWEGSAASMIGSLLVAYAFSYWIKIPLPHLFAMAVLGNIAGQMGDLLESAYKRSAGVKDSGGLLPGHGGVLDRIDALILCIPVIWYYLVLVNPPLR
jgi:phosphatidate cytidylyltransferase